MPAFKLLPILFEGKGVNLIVTKRVACFPKFLLIHARIEHVREICNFLGKTVACDWQVIIKSTRTKPLYVGCRQYSPFCATFHPN